jgi:hypothetical protein
MLDRHDDQAVGLVPDPVDLAEDPGDGVAGEADVTVAAGVAAGRAADRLTGVKAPRGNPADDRDLGAVLDRKRAGRARQADERQRRRQYQHCESEPPHDVLSAHDGGEYSHRGRV